MFYISGSDCIPPPPALHHAALVLDSRSEHSTDGDTLSVPVALAAALAQIWVSFTNTANPEAAPEVEAAVMEAFRAHSHRCANSAPL